MPQKQNKYAVISSLPKKYRIRSKMLDEKINKIHTLLNSRYHKIRVSDLIVYFMVLIYFVVFSLFTVARHYTFKTNAFDLGIENQALYTTLFNGKFFYETPDAYYTLSGSFFGLHFTPITFILLPIYYIYPHPETLLIFQSAVLALAAIPLYFLARTLMKGNNVIPVGLAAAYLMNPFIHTANAYDFHIECLLPLFSLMALYSLESKKWKGFVVFSILSAVIIDFAAIITFFIGIYGILKNWNPFIRLIKGKEVLAEEYDILIGSFLIVATSVLLIFLAIVTISYFGPPPLSSVWIEVFPKLGKNYADILRNIVMEPGRIISAISFDGIYKLIYLTSLFLPTFFLAFYSPKELILCFPWVAISALTSVNTLYQPNYHFGAFIVPFILYATTHSLAKLQPKNLGRLDLFKRIRTPLTTTILVMIAVSPLSPIPHASSDSAAYAGLPIPTHHTDLLQKAVILIPDNASVFAQNHIFAHFANRVDVFVSLPFGVIVDYAIADRTQHDYKTPHAFRETFQQQFEWLLNGGDYDVVVGVGDEFEKEGIMVLKRHTIQAANLSSMP